MRIRHPDSYLPNLDSKSYQQKLTVSHQLSVASLGRLLRTAPLPNTQLIGPRLQNGGFFSKSAVVAGNKLCLACREEKCRCYMPFPTKQFYDATYVDKETGVVGRWMDFGYSRKWMESDLDGIEKLSAFYSKQLGRKVITGWEMLAVDVWLEKMRKKCRGKLFFAWKAIQDGEAQEKFEELTHKAHIPLDSFGRRLPERPSKERA